MDVHDDLAKNAAPLRSLFKKLCLSILPRFDPDHRTYVSFWRLHLLLIETITAKAYVQVLEHMHTMLAAGAESTEIITKNDEKYRVLVGLSKIPKAKAGGYADVQLHSVRMLSKPDPSCV